MLPALLPSSAIAFAPRSPPHVVVNAMFPDWMKAKLKQVNRFRRPLNNSIQSALCLKTVLSQDNANWTLCSIMLPQGNVIDSLVFQIIHIEAYVVHVDMVSRNEVAFKLCQHTIDALVDFHQRVFLVDAADNAKSLWAKEAKLQRLQEEFVDAVNKFAFWTKSEVLLGLEQDGSGELLVDMSEKAKEKVIDLFKPLILPSSIVGTGYDWICPTVYNPMLADLDEEALAGSMWAYL
ncbi:hypothetical protein PMG11_11381 [Penicillium brasilianum]|uniref:Uncharacterized protein n=1 Tax=Penicillium brasilianum TaxID=104259 RepID=A0A0F7U3M7_PENBI|nr:hypothetical protein PMG11_11381 [Penicillium brasilianum]